MEENSTAASVVNCALEIHKELGPVLLESVYEVLLADALRERGFSVERQKPIPICFRGRSFLAFFASLARNPVFNVSFRLPTQLDRLYRNVADDLDNFFVPSASRPHDPSMQREQNSR